MSAKELIAQYYRSLAAKDNSWQDIWAEDATFADASRTLDAKGKAAVIASFTPFLRGVESVAVKQMITEGDNVCAIVAYRYVNPRGAHLDQDVAEVWRVEGESLKNLVIYFDLTAYRSFIAG